MKKHFSKALFLLFSIESVYAAMPLVNQLGFPPKADKIVILPGSEASPLEVRDLKTGKTVLTVKAPNVYEWEASGEEVQAFDISALKQKGTYQLVRAKEIIGNPLVIQDAPYEELSKAALKWFYFQRASTPLEARYAGKWARAAGHPDIDVQVYGEKRKIRSPKGWYDAGDYGKYVVNSGITMFTLLELYENAPEFFKTFTWDIPREFPNYPTLLEEIRWNMDWMLSMQDKDGGVFHKLTSLNFPGSVMPEKDTAKRLAIGKGVTASLDFAGVAAQASIVYKPFDKPYAEKLLNAAKKAYAYAEKHRTEFFTQPKDVVTGSYAPGDENGQDEFRFAETELFLATNDVKYLDALKKNPPNGNGPWWGDMNFLAVYKIALNPKNFGQEFSDQAKKLLLDEANSLLAEADTSGYRVPIHPWNWNWGSNSAVANNGIILLYAHQLTGDKKFLRGAQGALDYLLGKNPHGISFVTGFGFRSPKNPHHRPSESDEVDEPVPGMLVGGPHLGKQDIGEEPWKCKDYAQANKPALAYLDDRCSYATNEVAINWNAPLAYLSIMLQIMTEK